MRSVGTFRLVTARLSVQHDRARLPEQSAAAIQPCAWLLGFAQDWSISHVSANCGEWLECDPAGLPGRPAHAAINGDALHEIRSRAQVLAGSHDDFPAERMQGLDLAGKGRLVDATLQPVARGWLLTCEPASPGQRDRIGTALRMAAGLRRAGSLAELCNAAARDIRALTGFDRVQILRFGPGGQSLLLGESASRAAGEAAPMMFAGASASDDGAILFGGGRERIIADHEAAPFAILSLGGREPDRDAGPLAAAGMAEGAALAAMGARAMVSLPLIRDGAVWGAIACSHLEPRLVSFAVRPALELLALTLGLRLELLEPTGAAESVDAGGMEPMPAPPLAGRGLVVEDNMLIAMEAEEVVLELGAEACDVAASVAAALRLIDANTYDFALLDIELGRETSQPVASALAARGVPFVYASGYGGPDALAPGFPPAPVVTKPYGAPELAEAFRRLG